MPCEQNEVLSAAVTLERHQNIAVLWVDNPPVNAVNRAVLAGLQAGVAAVGDDDELRGAVIICRGTSFMSGADITEFGSEGDGAAWTNTLRALEDCAKPIISAMHKLAFGGGLELALACHGRIAEPGTVFAFPEVSLGVIPGSGGTQRFPRLVGYPAALDIIPSGRKFDAAEALKLGLIGAIFPAEALMDQAIAASNNLAAAMAGGEKLARARDLDGLVQAARAEAGLFETARDQVRKRWRDVDARLASIDAMENGLRLSFDEALSVESAVFKRLAETPQHRALSHLFFAERRARKVPGKTGKTQRSVRTVSIIGGGTMGRGIALAFAGSGFPVTLIEVSPEASAATVAACRRENAGSVAKGRMSQDAAARCDALIQGAHDLATAAEADLVVEAVHENMALKQRVFADLDRVAKPGAILATNTSNLDIDAIAASTKRPQDVIGLHFFSPANVMTLLEIVRGAQTSDEVLAAGLEIARALGKQPVVARVCDGFIVNRAFDGYWREALFLVEDGASPYDVDQALVDFGMPMGPFAVSDLVGLDVNQAIRDNQRQSIPPGARVALVEDALIGQGRLGRKSGAGWYGYTDGRRAGYADSAVLTFLEAFRSSESFVPRRIATDEIVQRCLYAVINEGARLLEEGVAIRSSDIDVAAVHGVGFPNWRGGPMHYAGEVGLPVILSAIKLFGEKDSHWWRPSRLLEDRACQGLTFMDA